MTSTNAIAVVLKFEQLINSGNPQAICSLLTEDSVFIDSLGNRLQGLASPAHGMGGIFQDGYRLHDLS